MTQIEHASANATVPQEDPSHRDRAPAISLPVDRRQSKRASAISRGTARLLVAHGLIPLAELTLPSGRRADLTGISDKGEIWMIEVKSGIEDFRTDSKWPDYRAFCDRFSFAVDTEFPLDVIPGNVGLVTADRFGAEIRRDAPLDRCRPAQRRAVTISYARAAAARLHGLYDPEMAALARPPHI